MENEAIKHLANDNSIVIKEGDKAGATILTDTIFHEKLDADPSKAEKTKYTKFLKTHKTCLTKKELGYLETFEVKSNNFDGLPKEHKSSQINDKCILN